MRSNKSAFIINRPKMLSMEPSVINDYLLSDQEYSFKSSDHDIHASRGLAIVLAEEGSYDDTYRAPDVFYFFCDFEGE